MEPTPNGENTDIFYLINFDHWLTPKLSVSQRTINRKKNNSFLWKCIPKCTLFNSFRCRICSVPVRLLWAFPLFCHPMSNDAPIATFSFSLSSFHRFLSLSKLSRHDSFANFSIWGLTSLSRAFSVDSPSDGTLIDDNNSFTWVGPMPTCSIPINNSIQLIKKLARH